MSLVNSIVNEDTLKALQSEYNGETDTWKAESFKAIENDECLAMAMKNLKIEINSEQKMDNRDEVKKTFKVEKIEPVYTISDIESDAKFSKIAKLESLELIKSDKDLAVCFDETYLSSKFEILMEMLNIIMEKYQNDKIIIFSQWTGVLNNISNKLKDKGIDFEYIHGKVEFNKRTVIMERYNNPEDLSRRVMLVSLGCGACNFKHFSFSIIK